MGGEDDDLIPPVSALRDEQVRGGPGQADLGPGCQGGDLGLRLCQDLRQAAAAAATGRFSKLSLREILSA